MKHDSDYDFIVVCSDWKAVLLRVFGREIELPDQFDCVAVRKIEIGYAKYGCVVFSKESFVRTSGAVSVSIRYFRPVDSKTQHLLCSVRGDREWVTTPEVEVAGGRVSDVPLAQLRGSDYFVGPVRESLLACPVILSDAEGWLKSGIRAHVSAASKGLAECGFPPDDSRLILRALSRSDRMSKWATESFMRSFEECTR